MLQQLIELWPGGPSLELGSYFVYFKYLFTILVVVFAVGSLRWPRRRWMLPGILVLTSLAFVAYEIPLARPYGLVDEGSVVEDVGHVMVIATRGGGDGRLVREPNPHPLWGRMLSVLAGFDSERLIALYRFVPLLSALVLVGAIVACAGGLEADPALPRGTLSCVSAFFVLFLSTHRLAFLETESTFWSLAFLRTPQVGIGLAGVCFCLRWLGGTSRHEWLGAVLALAFVGWIDPRLALIVSAGAVVWVLVAKRWGRLIVIATGLLLSLPFRPFAPVALPSDFGTFPDAVARVLSVTFDLALVFVLAMFGVRCLVRSARSRESLLAACTIVALVLWGLASTIPSLMQWLGPATLKACLLTFLSLAAAFGLHRLVTHYPRFPESWTFVPGALNRYPAPRVALAAFLLASLPWCLPYWWMPVRMDSTYASSVEPLSGNLILMAETIQSRFDPDAVFVAGPSYAPWIPALSGRRVLLAGPNAPNRAERESSQDDFVLSHDESAIATAAARWDITHLAWGRLDQPSEEGAGAPVDLTYFDASPRFEEVFRLRRWITIYAFEP